MKLEDYKKGSLPEEALQAITVELMKANLDKKYVKRWSKLLEEEHDFTRQAKPITKKRNLWVVTSLVAASIALCIGLFFYLKPTTEQLLAQHLSEPFATHEVRKGVSETEELRQQARTAYTKSDFEATINYYNQIAEARTTEDYFFLGLSQLYEDQLNDAIISLQSAAIQSQGKRDYQEEIDWFLALAYLKSGEKTAAKELLHRAIDEEYWIIKDAAKLLKSMKK